MSDEWWQGCCAGVALMGAIMLLVQMGPAGVLRLIEENKALREDVRRAREGR